MPNLNCWKTLYSCRPVGRRVEWLKAPQLFFLGPHWGSDPSNNAGDARDVSSCFNTKIVFLVVYTDSYRVYSQYDWLHNNFDTPFFSKVSHDAKYNINNGWIDSLTYTKLAGNQESGWCKEPCMMTGFCVTSATLPSTGRAGWHQLWRTFPTLLPAGNFRSQGDLRRR